jgi:glycosyltransferase involved in cell wall biosynthesis
MISVVIPTWNRAWSIRRAVDSVLIQQGVDFELIVVDDGSDDGTKELLAELLEARLADSREAKSRETESREADSREAKSREAEKIVYLRNDERRGVSAARNLGIGVARGDLIALLDSDDEWLPGKLSAQAKYMAERPDLMFSQCQERWVRDGRRVNPGLRHRKKEGDIFLESLALCLISPSAVIVRKRLFDEVGLFDEELAAAEDYDLWLRALLKYPVGLLDRELIIRHGGRPDQLSAAPGLDRYRALSLKKLLASPEALGPERERAVRAELARREEIFTRGRSKRIESGIKSDL